MNRELQKCWWCKDGGLLELYHDNEWGEPVHDDQKQFEYLMMEVMQCGLSWMLMLKKREIFRTCFNNFEYDKIALYTESDVQRILETPGMIRSERKINAVITNARCFQKIQSEFGSFSNWLWNFTDGKIMYYPGHEKGEIPVSNELSETIAADLKKRGFKYLGAITVYSHLQACGIINDHLENCFRYASLKR